MSKIFFLVIALLVLTSCGKEKKTTVVIQQQPSNSNGPADSTLTPVYTTPYTGVSPSPYMNAVVVSNIVSPYSYNEISVNSILNENPCINNQDPQARIELSTDLNGFSEVIPVNEIYAGVTSFGDVALVIGNGSQPPKFVAYVCPRSFSSNGTFQLAELSLGKYQKCAFNPIGKATLTISSVNEPLYFRMLEGGSSLSQRFSFCSI